VAFDRNLYDGPSQGLGKFGDRAKARYIQVEGNLRVCTRPSGQHLGFAVYIDVEGPPIPLPRAGSGHGTNAIQVWTSLLSLHRADAENWLPNQFFETFSGSQFSCGSINPCGWSEIAPPPRLGDLPLPIFGLIGSAARLFLSSLPYRRPCVQTFDWFEEPENVSFVRQTRSVVCHIMSTSTVTISYRALTK
jgi:hypothetical protein